MKLYVGTSGYSYKPWKGAFYPRDLPERRMLQYYGERLPAVEINSTFYRMPTASGLANWTEAVPTGFQFVIKAPRSITHERRLGDAAELLGQLVEATTALDEHQGPLLFQTPPNLKKDVRRLQTFLALLPRPRRTAFEFRHASWFDDEVFEILRAHGAALCIADADDELEVPFQSTADWGYLRLRRPTYGDVDMKGWLDRARDAGWTSAFVFFKHEDAGEGPRMALRLQELARAS